MVKPDTCFNYLCKKKGQQQEKWYDKSGERSSLHCGYTVWVGALDSLRIPKEVFLFLYDLFLPHTAILLLQRNVWRLKTIQSIQESCRDPLKNWTIRDMEEVCSGVPLHNLARLYMLCSDLHCTLEDYYPVLNFNFDALHLKLNVWPSGILAEHLWLVLICSKAVSLLPSSPLCLHAACSQRAAAVRSKGWARSELKYFHINCCAAVCTVKLRKGWGAQSGRECKMQCAGIIRKRKLSNFRVVLESWYPFIFTIRTGQLDRSSVYSWSSGSASELLRHICVIHWHTYSLFSKSSLIYANVPLSMCDRGIGVYSAGDHLHPFVYFIFLFITVPFCQPPAASPPAC